MRQCLAIMPVRHMNPLFIYGLKLDLVLETLLQIPHNFAGSGANHQYSCLLIFRYESANSFRNLAFKFIIFFIKCANHVVGVNVRVAR